MNFPILSAIIFIPLIGAFFYFCYQGRAKKMLKEIQKYVAIFTSLSNFFLSILLWYFFDNSTSDFQFIEEKKMDVRLH